MIKKQRNLLTVQQLFCYMAIQSFRSNLQESKIEVLEKNLLDALLKGKFENHVKICPLTKLEYAFNKTKVTKQYCRYCNLPLKVLDYLSIEAPQIHYHLIADCCKNIILYIAYCVRVKNEQDKVDKMMFSLKANEAVYLLNFKMKFEIKYCRENFRILRK